MAKRDKDSTPVSMRNFVAARVDEVVAISKELEIQEANCKNPGLVFQHVPKHMRRRAVSHNVKRLPKRLHLIHLNQLQKSNNGELPTKPKRSSRKYRRRKSNLLSEYNRRQLAVKWMETHIWHAKRFHMEKKWNCQIPLQPTDKSYRAIYRASKNYSAMQDISFTSCLQLSGPFKDITNKMKQLAPESVNRLSLGAKYYTKYSREGSLHLYEYGKYPFGYIGRVTLIWKLDLSSVWIWVHPSFKQQLLDELIRLFELKEAEIQFSMEIDDNVEKSVDAQKLVAKNLHQPKCWENITSKRIELVDLEGALNRFSITGPQSTAILQEILKVKESITLPEEAFTETFWYEDYYAHKRSFWEKQASIWHGKQDYSHFPSNLILPLTVRDPRIFLPNKRSKLELGEEFKLDKESFQNLVESYHKDYESPLFNHKWRNLVTNQRMSDNEFSKCRSELLIPGSQINLGRNENQIPIVLIQKPDQIKGWDIIIPAGYAMSFWVALSYRCVRACGHRDAINYAFSHISDNASHKIEAPFTSLTTSNLFHPDSIAGQEETTHQYNYLEETYFRLPTDKRQEFHRLRCPFPFQISWPKLLQYSQSHQEEVPNLDITQPFVLRESKILEKLRLAMTFKSFKKETSLSTLSSLSTELPLALQNCLIPICIISEGRGKPQPNCILNIPTQNDLEHFFAKDLKNPEKFSEEQTPTQEFLNNLESQKSSLRQKHKKDLAFLRKKRKKELERKNKNNGEISEKLIIKSEFNSTNIIKEYNKKMNELFLPQDPITILNEISRITIGFITFGNENYKIGKCAGIGYISWFGFIQLVKFYQSYYNYLFENIKHNKRASKLIKKRMKQLILFRDCKSSLVYRFAKLYIC